MPASPSHLPAMLARLNRLRLLLLERLPAGDLPATLLAAALVGLLGALATVAFRELLHGLGMLWFGRADGLVATARGLEWWHRLWIPAAGGVAAGLVLRWAQRFDAPGDKRDYMEAITLGDGHIGARASLVRALSSALSVASGASIGREAPMVQLAALTGSLIGRWRRMPRQRLRLLVACGAAAGLSAAYNAPIAGALFVAEIVLGSFAIEALGPLIVASVVANLTVHQFLGFAPLYKMPVFELVLGLNALPFLGLALVAGLCAPVYLQLLALARRPFARLGGPLWLRLGAGGLIVGIVSTVEPGVWGNGYSVVNAILQGGWLWPALLAILAFKFAATGAATGSGAVGGVFTPTLFVGAALGGLFGIGMEQLWPGAVPMPAWVAAGMGAFLAAASHAPLMSAVMIFEMTGNAQIILPLLLVCVCASALKQLLRAESLYSHSLPVAVPEPDAASLLRAAPPMIPETATPAEAEAAFLASRWQHLYVHDPRGRFIGALSLHDFGPFQREHGASAVAIPPGLLRRDYPRVSLDAGLGEILATFAQHSGERLPVLDLDGRLRGYVSKTDVMLALQERAPGGRG
ncbi:MAG: chloride channel protein [Candidatus Dactylopiibacterium carminicum]|uniref:Chloride channel protein n=2 Tax=Candidatus Dactylopiibacterium carminicum TaxID=857335 RepID=A0A272EVQ5_9RHOO|nr:chloride channel protein [Candidatus Dactylopiibacterium carminicum]PAS94185.1 MAG: chloride channel protein [Candidatus Dactylopiibacterium carminicum]